MKKVTLLIDDAYSEVLSITAIGRSYNGGMVINVSTKANEIKNGDIIAIGLSEGDENDANQS